MKYKIFTTEYKKYILEQTNNSNKEEIAKIFGISKKTLYRWQKNGIKLEKHSGRKIQDINMEKKLIEWYNEELKKRTVKSKEIKNKAKELSNNINFKASKGWFQKFKKRNKI